MNMDVGKFLRKYLRKTHRWLSLPFAGLVVTLFLARNTPYGPLAQQAQQVLLLVMAVTGLYLFLLPYWTKRNRGREEDRSRASLSGVRSPGQLLVRVASPDRAASQAVATAAGHGMGGPDAHAPTG